DLPTILSSDSELSDQELQHVLQGWSKPISAEREMQILRAVQTLPVVDLRVSLSGNSRGVVGQRGQGCEVLDFPDLQVRSGKCGCHGLVILVPEERLAVSSSVRNREGRLSYSQMFTRPTEPGNEVCLYNQLRVTGQS